MSTEFKLPELAEGVESAEITQILVAVGDSIEEEQPVLELETGKATAEIPSSVAGTVDSIAVKEGEEVSIGDVILTVSEAADEEAAEQSKGEESTEEETPVRAQKGEDEETEGKGQGEEKAEGRESERRGAEDRERAAAPSKASGPPESEKVSESSARAGG
ncbi:MAG: biotin/lipoyl-binding protein, partial [Candidatus Pacebacteria bacterium]|nr:biotin/lipoyl-binding protein [Candidatus Paceibacterota bacterium]